MTYQVQYFIDYEGYSILHFDTLKEVMVWVEDQGAYVNRWHGGFSIYRVEEVTLTELEGKL